VLGDVDPFVGTAPGDSPPQVAAGIGNTFPGPVLPGGMIQLGPDTAPDGAGELGGYSYADSEIAGFSLLHLSGAGCGAFGNVSLTPADEPPTSSPAGGASDGLAPSYYLGFSHHDESAHPGYYAVRLHPSSGGAIGVRLTSATRAAVAQFAFPRGSSATVLLDAAAGAGGTGAADVRVDPARDEVTGSATSGHFCGLSDNLFRVYFAATFDQPMTGYGTWRRDVLSKGSSSTADTSPDGADSFAAGGPTAQAGTYLEFSPRPGRPVTMRVAVSYVSVAGAARNLEAEVGHRSFAQVRAAAQAAWSAALARIDVGGGPPGRTRRFYTALYQAQIEPSTFSDVDGRYEGMDGRVHVARGYTQVSNLSMWDTYRTQVPLLALVAPGRVDDLVRSLLADASQSGWLPKWAVADGQTEIMTGDSADAVIADAESFGATGFPAGRALAAMEKGATTTGLSAGARYLERPGLAAYLRLGYVPSQLNAGVLAMEPVAVGPGAGAAAVRAAVDAARVWGSAGTTLEYAVDDFAIAEVARADRRPAACEEFLRRSGDWRSVFDRATGYVEPRAATGAFPPGFDPDLDDALSTLGFAEGSAAQYTWLVPQDPAGLAGLLGGEAAAAARLRRFLGVLNAGPSSGDAYLGDEVTLDTPWLGDWFGAPATTEWSVRRAATQLFGDGPGGLPGNDDLGTLSAWYVFASIGLYPGAPGSGVLAVSAPLFPSVVVHLAHKVLRIAAGGARGGEYVSAMRVDGVPTGRPWLAYAALAGGGSVRYTLSASPTSWGTAAADAPPSYAPSDAGFCS
jgi:predicted alpha-1,2-mannosidase